MTYVLTYYIENWDLLQFLSEIDLTCCLSQFTSHISSSNKVRVFSIVKLGASITKKEKEITELVIKPNMKRKCL